MAFNGSGVFARIYSWATESASPPIAISKLDTQEEDIATGLSTCITKDGQTTITADIPFNDKKITGLGDATADDHALNRGTADGRYPSASDFSSGTFTGTLTGFGSNPTGTVSYIVAKNIATLYFASTGISGTSNSTAMTMTGLPAAVRPTITRGVVCSELYDNSNTNIIGGCTINSSGVITFQLFVTNAVTNRVTRDSSAFTSSGDKGLLNQWQISYPL